MAGAWSVLVRLVKTYQSTSPAASTIAPPHPGCDSKLCRHSTVGASKHQSKRRDEHRQVFLFLHRNILSDLEPIRAIAIGFPSSSYDFSFRVHYELMRPTSDRLMQVENLSHV